MTKLKLIPESEFLLLSKERQYAYLLRARHMIQEGTAQNISHWLFFLVIAVFEGNTDEIIGTPTMSTYKDYLFNQILP